MAAILDAAPGQGETRARREERLLLTLLVALWFALTLPLASGQRTLFQRDVFGLHLPRKAFGAAELAAGRIPAVDPGWALGQPFRGDPNVLPFYPDNLLYLALPFWSAFNLHYLLHWLLGFFGMRALFLALGRPRRAALVAALTWAGCGFGLSLLTFYNLVVVAAWWPWAMAGLARGGRRGVAGAALALGFALLGGEPVTAALGLVPLALVAFDRHGWRRGLASLAAAGAGALLVAAPQLVATARVIGFTTRGTWGVAPAQVGRFALHPVRLVELLLPLPFGWPTRFDRFDFWSLDLFPLVPFVMSLHLGIVGLAAAVVAARRQRGLAILAAAGLAAAWLGGVAPGLLARASAGLFRYPEKFLFWFALAGALLAGAGTEQLALTGWRTRRKLLLSALGPLLLAVAGMIAFPELSRLFASWMTPAPKPHAPATQAGLLIAGLLSAALLLAALAFARRRPGVVVLLQLAALAPLAPLWATVPVAPFRAPAEWQQLLPPGAAVAHFVPTAEPPPAFDPTLQSMGELAWLRARELDPAPGRLHGLSYPIAPDTAGIFSPLSARLDVEIRRLDWPRRAAWLRRLGADALVERASDPARVPLPQLAAHTEFGVETRLRAIPEPAPLLRWPRRVEMEPDPHAAVARLGEERDPLALALVPEAVAHEPGATVTLVAAAPDRIEAEVSGDGGLLVVRRAFLPLYRAGTAEGEPLATLPADVALLGVVVPPGTHRVTIAIDSVPERVAGLLAVLAALGLLALLTWRPR